MSDEFHIDEDDWGLVSLIPEENLDHAQSIFRQAEEHHKDTVFSEHGWATRPFFIPAPEVGIAERAIMWQDLAECLGGLLPEAPLVSMCGLYRDEWFAFGETYRLSLYGCQTAAVVTTLHLLNRSATSDTDLGRLAGAISRFGSRHRLILVDWLQASIIPLHDGSQVLDYLSRLS